MVLYRIPKVQSSNLNVFWVSLPSLRIQLKGSTQYPKSSIWCPKAFFGFLCFPLFSYIIDVFVKRLVLAILALLFSLNLHQCWFPPSADVLPKRDPCMFILTTTLISVAPSAWVNILPSTLTLLLVKDMSLVRHSAPLPLADDEACNR